MCWREKNETLTKENAELSDKIQEAVASDRELHGVITKLREELKISNAVPAKKEDIDDQPGDSNLEDSKVYEREINALNNELATVTDENQLLHSKLKEEQSLLREATETSEGLRSTIQGLTEQNDKMVQDLESKIRQLEEEISKLNSNKLGIPENVTNGDADIAQSRNQSSLILDSNSSSALVEAKETFVWKLCEELSIREVLANERVLEYKRLQEKSQVKEEELSKKLVQLARKYKLARAKLQKQSKESSEMKKELSDAKNESQKLQDEYQDESEKKYLKLQEETSAKVEALQACVEELAKNKEIVESQNKVLTIQVQEQVDQISRQQKTIASLEDELRLCRDEAKASKEIYNNEAERLETEINSEKLKSKKSEEHINELKSFAGEVA